MRTQLLLTKMKEVLGFWILNVDAVKLGVIFDRFENSVIVESKIIGKPEQRRLGHR